MQEEYSSFQEESNKKPRWDRKESTEHTYLFERSAIHGVSQREYAKEAEVPRTTLQYWLKRKEKLGLSKQVVSFFESPDGLAFLHRLVIAAQFTMTLVGASGIRPLSLFLELSSLSEFVASSYGSQQKAVSAMEQTIVEFGANQQAELSVEMKPKKITVCEDETFHPEICLVAIEPVSNYILLEEYAKNRDSSTWNEAMEKNLCGLRVEIIQSTADDGTGLVKHIKEGLGAHHSPDLFHVQHEIVKGTSAALCAKIRKASKELEEAIQATQKQIDAQKSYEETIPSHRQGSEALSWFEQRVKQAKEQEQQALQNEENAQRCKQITQESNQELSKIYHPYDLESGKPKTPEQVERALQSQFEIIENQAKEAGLADRAFESINKAKKQITKMIATIAFFFQVVSIKVQALGLPDQIEQILYNNWIPGLYLMRVAKQAQTAKEREILKDQAQLLLAPIRNRDGPLQYLDSKEFETIESVAIECANLFQRSSSCVEGRNGQLSLRHHSLHRIYPRKLKALTVIHNFFIRRTDGTTAAERFFGAKHKDLFDYLLDRLDVPCRPAKTRLAYEG